MIRDDNDNHLMDDAHIAIQGGIISFSKDGSCDFDQYSAGASSCRWKLVNNDSILVITVERGGITDSMRLDVNSITKDKLIFDSEVNFGSATSIIIHHLWMVYERP